MRTITIERYDRLTRPQWRRVVRSAKRHVRRITGQSCEIGVGRKYTGGKPRGPQLALRVYLPRKRRRVATSRTIPPHFEIRLRRDDGCYDLVRIRSDVESLSSYVPTAGTVSLGNRQATTGLLLRWINRDADICWGFATVDHLYDETSLRHVSVRLSASTVLRCRRETAPPKRRHDDLCVLRILGERNAIERALADAGLIDHPRQRRVRWMSVQEVQEAVMRHRRGRSYSSQGRSAFIAEEVFPDGFPLGRRRLNDCIRVAGAPVDSFRRGTSGATWFFGTTLACMQVGGKRPDFKQGIGQPIARYLDWLRSALGDDAEWVAVLK